VQRRVIVALLVEVEGFSSGHCYGGEKKEWEIIEAQNTGRYVLLLVFGVRYEVNRSRSFAPL
jgi:hypothetical protein